jgi:hypothetical protein
MLDLHEISTDTTAFPWTKRTTGAGLQLIIAIAIALLVGHACGHPSAGAIAAGAAYTVGFAIFHETLASALLSMALLTLGIASATLVGSFGAEWTPIVLLLTLIAAINYGLLAGISATAGWMGQQCAIYVIVSSYFPMGPKFALGRTGMVLAGGALQMLIFTLFHRARHPAVESIAPPLHHRLKSRILALWQQLRTETHLHSDTAAYTVRVAITLLLCTELYRHFHVRNGYWSPMTAIVVLKPKWTNTFNRSTARLAGTMVGVAIAFLLAQVLPNPDPMLLLFALVLLCAWGCYAFQAVNYAVFSLFVTLYIIFLFHFGGFSQRSAAHIRLFNTALGGAVALSIDIIWKLLTPKAHAEVRTIETL